MPIVSFPRTTGPLSSEAESLRALLEKAIHASNCFVRSVLDARLVGVSFDDLRTNIFKRTFDCTYQFDGLSIALNCTPDQLPLRAEPLTGGLNLAGASAALVIVETPDMPEMNARHLARNWMNAVRSQMPKSADCFYAVTINNDLKDQCKVSVLAVSPRGEERCLTAS